MKLRAGFRPNFWMMAALCLSLSACNHPYATQNSGSEVDDSPSKQAFGQDTFKNQVIRESIDIHAQLTDALITSKVKAAFYADATLAATDIQVSTTACIVTLTGHVPSLAISEKASEISRAISDVKEVSNSLIIATGAPLHSTVRSTYGMGSDTRKLAATGNHDS